jgi:hypothetical protein
LKIKCSKTAWKLKTSSVLTKRLTNMRSKSDLSNILSPRFKAIWFLQKIIFYNQFMILSSKTNLRLWKSLRKITLLRFFLTNSKIKISNMSFWRIRINKWRNSLKKKEKIIKFKIKL